MAFHENLVGLVEAFLDGSSVYLAYNYYGFAVSFAQVVSTPAVELSDPDFASVCRSVLRGLQYIHEQLQVGHGKIDSSNVLLCYDGTVKIGKSKYCYRTKMPSNTYSTSQHRGRDGKVDSSKLPNGS